MRPDRQARFYAGVGSPKTPPEVLAFMEKLAARLAGVGYGLRSGAIERVDAAFERGCAAAGGRLERWLPWPGYNGVQGRAACPSAAHRAVAERLHPGWASLTRTPRGLLARSVGQVLGGDAAPAAEFVVCWTPDGCETGEVPNISTAGPGLATVVAPRYGIPVFNLKNADARDRLYAHVLDAMGQQRAAACRQ